MSKKKRNKKSTERIVQDEMPLADIAGHYALMKDGSYRAYMRVTGTNHSLYNTDQKIMEAFAYAEVWSGIRTTFGLLKYPLPSSSSRQLHMIDRAIERERQEGFQSTSIAREEAARKKAAILEEHMRPEAKKEATSAERINWPTWIVLSYPKSKPVNEAERELETLRTLASSRLNEPIEFASEADIRLLCQLYFTPSTAVGPETPIYAQIPLPEII